MNAIAQASAAPTTGPKLDNRRVLAALVDVAIVAAGTVVILFAGDALSGDRGGALAAVILGWALYYYFAMESGDGQTVGKKLMKLRVVRADGRPAGMREIAVRTVLRVVDGVGAYIVGLIVMLATGQRRQRLGDLAAGTIVVDASAAVAAPPAPVAKPGEDAPVDGESAEGDVEPEPEFTSYNTPTISLPSRPAPPATVEDLAAPETPAVPEMRPFEPPLVEDEPAAEAEPEPVVEPEPVDEPEPAAEAEPVEDEDQSPPALEVVENEPVAAFQVVEGPAVHLVEPVEDEVDEPTVQLVEPLEEEPVEDEPVAAVEVVEAEPVVADEPVVEEQPVAEEPLPDISTPSLEELARDVAAARSEPVPVVEADVEEDSDEDEPMTLKSVETVSAIDLVMGGAPEEDDSSEQDQDPEPPAAS